MDQQEIDLVATVQQLARDSFAKRAETVDREGTVSAENFADLRELGIPGIGLSRSRGGLGMGTEARVRVMEAIAYGDASTAVTINMHVLNTDALIFAPAFDHREKVLDDVAQNGAMICFPGSVPLGQLDTRKAGLSFREDGDVLVANGKTGFGTASDVATYVLAVGSLEGDPDDTAPGDQRVVLALPRTTDRGVTVLGNWDAMGLRATASHDVVLDEVVIPRTKALITTVDEFRRAAAGIDVARSDAPQDHRNGMLGVLAIWLGTAQAAFDFTLNYSAKRYGFNTVPTARTEAGDSMRSDQAWAQIDIGHMDHWIGTGRTLLYDLVDELGTTSYKTSPELTQKVTRVSYHLRRMSEEVAQTSMRVCGAHAFVKGCALERIFRDMVGSNVMALKTEQMAQSLGKGALGMPIAFSGPAGS
jgi:alkylation response protein AidB-like acyl-CoA dehydrogenase